MSKLLNTLPQKPLDQEIEFELAARIQEHQRESDKNELAMSAMKDAILYMMRCCRGKMSEGEVYSLAYAGLLKAAKNFRPGRVRFIGYAKPYLRGEISREWRSRDQVKSSSLHETEVIPKKYDWEEREHIGENLPRGVENEGLESKRHTPVYPEFELIDIHEKWKLVSPVMENALNEHERTVLALHYEGGLSFEEISEMVVPKVSRSAIEAVHSRALRKVRNVLFRDKKLYL